MPKTMTITQFVFILLGFLAISCQQQKTPLKGEYETSLVYAKFIDPPNEFRSFPFYSLNDRLDTTELKSQIRGFKNAGFGGFYLHSRDGLLTEFLGTEWWENMQAAVDAANETGLQVMFYDEDKWPSGYAGGIIPRMDETFRAKCLARLDKNTPLPNGSVVLKTNGQYNYIQYTAQLGNPIFNGSAYVDLMNPEMVGAFLNVSYQPYIEKYKHQIKGYTTGIFADEPHIHARYFDRKTPEMGLYSYSPSVREKFKALFGYDFVDKINLLFEETDNWREVRLHYHQAVALQFEESFTKQISAYCEANGIKYTGHYLAEDVLQKVRDRAGNTMLHYRNMQQPGMDNLGLGFDGKLITARALSSTANQYDIPKRLTEIFGISGQNMNFEDRKWIAGWHAINGVNHFCPHLTLYSMKGLRKRDYPPTFSYHQPYWAYNKKIEDYLARISYASTIGKYAPQLLVINPLESEYLKGDNEGEFTNSTLTLLEALETLHYDYDLGDEQIMSDTAFVKNGKIHIGAMQYEAVIMPDLIELRSSTSELLLKLVKQGGKVIYVDRFPAWFDGKENTSLHTSLKNNSVEIPISELKEKLPQFVKPNVIIAGEQTEKLWVQVRQTINGTLIQLSNTSHLNPIQFHVESALFDNNVVLWNPSTAKCYQLKKDEDNGYLLEIEPSSNVWLTSGSLSNNAQNISAYSLPIKKLPLLELSGSWKGKRLDPNALTIDFAAYSTNKGQSFSTSEPVIGIFGSLNDQGYNGNLILKYKAIVDDLPTNASLVVEQPEMYNSISINGQPLNFDRSKFYIDHSFPVANINNLLKKGENTIQMNLEFRAAVDTSSVAALRYGTEIESIYLIGDFGVEAKHINTSWNSQRNNDRHMQKRPVYGMTEFIINSEKEDFNGNMAIEGYPFYAGAFELKKTFTIEKINTNEHYYLDLPNTETIVSLVTLNGTLLDTLCWAPFRVDLTDAIREGTNEISITLINSLRNLLGPHHQQREELTRVGPYSFSGSGGFPDPKGDSDWFEKRLNNQPMRLWTDTYYLIPFGFIEPPLIYKSAE